MGVDNESRLCLGVRLQKGSVSVDSYSSSSSEDSTVESSSSSSSSSSPEDSTVDYYRDSDVFLLYVFLKGRGITFKPSYYGEDEEFGEDDMDFAQLIITEWNDMLELVNKELKKSGSMFRVNHAEPYFDCRPQHVVLYVNHKSVKDDWGHQGISLSEAKAALEEIDVEEMNALLKEFGIEKQMEPRLFSLPHVY